MDDAEKAAALIREGSKSQLIWSHNMAGPVNFLIERCLCKSGSRVIPALPSVSIGVQFGGKKVSALAPQTATTDQAISIPGVTLVLPGTQESAWQISSTLDFIMIYFRGEAQQMLREKTKEQDYPLALKDSLSGALVKQLAALLDKEEPDHDEHMASLANTLVHQLDYILTSPHQYQGIGTVGSRYPFVEETIDYINNHLGEKLSIKELSEKSGLQASYFRGVFKRVTGSSLHRYITKARLTKAHELLASTQIPIANIAEDLGFSSQSHFSMAFKRRYGINPGQFRVLKLTETQT